MVKKTHRTRRREESLSRDRIIEASIVILDSSGEGGLTFRTLSERLATGPGAIYWHIANKSELLTAACDAIDAHPWVGSALAHAPGQLPMVRILEGIGRQLRALGVPHEQQWATVSA